VGTNDLALGAVFGSRIRDDGILSSHIVDNTLTGNDINESTLQGVTKPACNSPTGAVKGFAKIDVSALQTSFSTTGVLFPYNCSGQQVTARREIVAPGNFIVKFEGNGVQIAFAATQELFAGNMFAQVSPNSPGEFYVKTKSQDANQNFVDSSHDFAIILF
jgi:hypothetical protein